MIIWPILLLSSTLYYLQYQAATRRSPLSDTSQTCNSVACLIRSSPTCPWILDSGASDHISGNQDLFSNLIHSATPFAFTVANGSRIVVKGIGDEQLLPSISLNLVLFAPECPFNLISVSKLTKHLNCSVTFLADSIVQDRGTGRRLEQDMSHRDYTTCQNHRHQLPSLPLPQLIFSTTVLVTRVLQSFRN